MERAELERGVLVHAEASCFEHRHFWRDGGNIRMDTVPGRIVRLSRTILIVPPFRFFFSSFFLFSFFFFILTFWMVKGQAKIGLSRT